MENLEFKGTPGKWVVDTIKDSEGEISEVYILQESGGCIVCINDGDDNYDIPNDVANATLIAAAPDLLEALQKAVKDYGKPGGPWNVPAEPGTWIAMAKDAIQKALTPPR